MEIGALLILAAIALGVGFYLAIPFLDPRPTASAGAREHELSHLLAERDRFFIALEELDFSYSLGKVPDEADPGQRARLLHDGAEVLRQIDALEWSALGAGEAGSKSAPITVETSEANAEARIEEAVAARRADASAGSPFRDFAAQGPAPQGSPAIGLGDDEIESRVAARRSERRDKSGGFCPNCGKAILVSDKFCPHCGRAIK